MNQTSRRQFLKILSQTGGAAAAMSALPASIAKALSIEAESTTGSIQDVQHVVIFMQENRSFDHYFGRLMGVRGFGDPRPSLLRNGKAVWFQSLDDGQFQLPFHLSNSDASADPNVADRSQCQPSDLPHNWKYSQKMWAYYDIWIKEKTSMCMGYLQRDDIPFYYALADAFTIGDAYHASVFGPTDPNRLFLFSGTNGVSVSKDGRHTLTNVDDGNETACMSRDKKNWKSPYHWTTYAERLSAANISWKVYQEYDNFGDNALAYFPQFRNLDLDDPAQRDRYQRARAWAGETNEVDWKGLPRNTNTPDSQALVDAFAADVKAGRLPAVSWIVAPTKFCEHPEKNPPGYGESLTSRLLDALTAEPSVWAKTVFILCYDEEGGFFDHVAPPVVAAAKHDGASTISTQGEVSHGEAFGLGARLPFMAISPWSRGGYVCSEVFDHTSIIRFLEKRFGVQEPNISAWRRAICGDLTSMFDFSQPNSARPNALFQTPHQNYIDHANSSCVGVKTKVSHKPQQFVEQEKNGDAQQLARFGNTRLARALPYQVIANGSYQQDNDTFQLSFLNQGAAATSITVYPSGHNAGPWYFTVGKKASIEYSWPLVDFSNEKYSLRLHGPNGFMQVFQGTASSPIEVSVAIVAAPAANIAQLSITITNRSTRFQSVTLKDNFYGAPTQSVDLQANDTQRVIWTCEQSFAWYDFSVLVADDKEFLRRYAGHIEKGMESRSDPANGKLAFKPNGVM